MKIVRDLIQDIQKRQNLDIYITVIIAFVVSILGIFQITDLSVITSAILGTLALVSISMLVNRRENDELQKAISKIELGGNIAEKFLSSGDDASQISKHIQNAQKVYFLGTSLMTLTRFVKPDIEKGLQKGLEVRFLLMKPNGTALRQASMRSGEHDDKHIREILEMSLYNVKTIRKNVSGGRLDCRVIDFIPAFDCVVIDPHLPTGHMFVHIPVFHAPTSTRPRFQLSNKNDIVWFNFFREQFDLMWNVAELVEIISS